MRFTRILAIPGVAAVLAAGFALAPGACNDSPGAVGDLCPRTDWKCATPTCSNFPSNIGCDLVAPIGGYCPLDHSRCFDPTTVTGYCSGSAGICYKPKSPYPMSCPPPCSAEQVAVCNDVDTAHVFCHDPYFCAPFAAPVCHPDGGSDDGGGDMAGGDLAKPVDMAGSPNFD